MNSPKSLRVCAVYYPALAAAIFLLISGFGLSLWVYQSQQSQRRIDASADAAKQAPYNTDSRCWDVFFALDHSSQCIPKQPAPGDDKSYSRADLNAQQDMSAWAFGALIFAAVQTFLSAASIILLLRNLGQVNEQNRLQLASLDKADLTFQLQREQFLAERRPWVAVERVEAAGPFEYQEVHNRWQTQIGFVLRNVGGSPAQEVRVYGREERPFRNGHFDQAEIRKKIEAGDLEEWRPRNLPRVIFPSDPITHVEYFEFPDNQLSGGHAVVDGALGAFEAVLGPSIYGYVAYKSTLPGDTRIHLTGFNVRLGFRNGVAGRGPFVFHPDEVDFADIRATADQIIITQHPHGWTAD